MKKKKLLTAQEASGIASTMPTFDVQAKLERVLEDIRYRAEFAERKLEVRQAIHITSHGHAVRDWGKFDHSSRNELINELERLGYHCSELKNKDNDNCYLNVEWY